MAYLSMTSESQAAVACQLSLKWDEIEGGRGETTGTLVDAVIGVYKIGTSLWLVLLMSLICCPF